MSAGRGIGGVQVTTPGGQTATKVGTAGGVRGPGGNGAVGGRSVTGTNGPRHWGERFARRRGCRTRWRRRWRHASRHGHGARRPHRQRRLALDAASNPYSAYLSTSRGVAVGGVGHRTTYVGATTLRTQGVDVRRSFVGYNTFSTTWYRAHPAALRVPAWTAATFWAWSPYANVAVFCGYPPTPVIYDYGSNIVYEDNRVDDNGEPIATAEEYANQALQLAAAGQEAKPADTEEWTPLGVFGMLQGDETDANSIFQPAINKNGVIRGNFYNVLTDTTVPVYGSVDKKTQCAAWTVGDKKDTVYETGLANLSEPETQMLIHFGKDAPNNGR